VRTLSVPFHDGAYQPMNRAAVTANANAKPGKTYFISDKSKQFLRKNCRPNHVLTLVPRKSGNRVRRERWWSSAGEKPRPGAGSFHPVAIRAAVEATRLLKPLVQRVARRLGERAGRNVSER